MEQRKDEECLRPEKGKEDFPTQGQEGSPAPGHGDNPYGAQSTPQSGSPWFPPYGQTYHDPAGGHPGYVHGYPGGAPGHLPKYQEHRYGISRMVADIAKGDPNWAGIAQWIDSTGGDFWKGALVGAVVTLVLTNESVKKSIGNFFAGLFGGKKEEKEG